MEKFKGLMTSLSPHWSTPKWIYDELDKEFHFDYDPCPLNSEDDNLCQEWGKRNFINPPYGRSISAWIEAAYNCKGLCVMLLPARTDTKWWHEWVMLADEIRFIKGRLRFGNSKNNAPFPSCVVIFNNLKPTILKKDKELL